MVPNTLCNDFVYFPGLCIVLQQAEMIFYRAGISPSGRACLHVMWRAFLNFCSCFNHQLAQ